MTAANRSTTSKHSIGASRVRLRETAPSATLTSRCLRARHLANRSLHDQLSALLQPVRTARPRNLVFTSRTAIYEKTRIDPVTPSLLYPFVYRLASFNRFPLPYRHLAAAMVHSGQDLAKPIAESWQKEKRSFGKMQECGLPHEIEFPEGQSALQLSLLMGSRARRRYPQEGMRRRNTIRCLRT